MDWVKQLNEVTSEDLDAVELRLTQLNDEAAALRALKAVFRAKLSIRPEQPQVAAKTSSPVPPAPAVKVMATAPPANGPTTQQYRASAVKFLAANGPTKPSIICAECDIPVGSTGAVFNHLWFTRTDRGVELTQDGKKAATSAA